jgi:hypothetical protein
MRTRLGVAQSVEFLESRSMKHLPPPFHAPFHSSSLPARALEFRANR